MRSTTSSNELRTIVRDNFRKFWTVPALVMAWYLFWGCLPMLLTWEPEYMKTQLMDLALNENMGYCISMVVLGMGAGMTLFSYLQNPGAANYMHSLPASRDRLFIAQLVSGLLMITGPILVNGVLMMVLSVTYAGVSPLFFLKWMVITWICAFAIFALTVLAAMLSGNTLMHLFNASFLCGFVSVFLLVIYMVCGSLLKGYAPSDAWQTTLMVSNPILAAVGHHALSRWWICAIYLVAGLLALVLARLLYQRRRIERTGESVMFPWVRTGLFLYCIFCGSILIAITFADIVTDEPELHFSGTMAVGGVVGALLIYVIGSLMIDRSSKIFTRRNLTPAVLALVLAFAVTLGVSDDLLGYGSKVPDTSEVETVYLNAGTDMLYYDALYDGMGYSTRFDASYYDVPREDTAVLKGIYVIGLHSTEAIDAARGLQQALIDQAPAGDDASVGSVTFIYDLKNGRRMQREYIIYQHDSADYAANPAANHAANSSDNPSSDSAADPSADSAAGSSTDYAADYFPGVEEAVAAFYDSKEFRQAYSLDRLKPLIFGSGTITMEWTSQEWEDGNSSDSSDADAGELPDEDEDTILSCAIPRKYASSLQKALEADFQECSYEDSRQSSAHVLVRLPASSWDDIAFPVFDDGPHMKQWLKKHQALLK